MNPFKPSEIIREFFTAPIAGFSAELSLGYNSEKVYTGIGINPKYLNEVDIAPYEVCVAYPLEGKTKPLIKKLKENIFEIIPLDNTFTEAFEISDKGIVLPDEFEKEFGNARYIILNFTLFRYLKE